MNDTEFFDDDLMQRRNAVRSSPVQSRESGSGAQYDEIPVRPTSDLNLSRMARHREKVNTRVASTMQELEQYRRRQTELERQKQALEDLARKQEEYEKGRQEMRTRLNQSIVALEKQSTRAARMAEVCSGTRSRFAAMLTELDGINDETWPEDTFNDELAKATSLIESTRKEYNDAIAAVEVTGGERLPSIENSLVSPGATANQPAVANDFISWLKIGFALMLPLGVLIILVGMMVVLFGKGH
jgi:hypothetical protein